MNSESPYSLTREFYQIFKGLLTLTLHNLFHKIEEGETLLNSFRKPMQRQRLYKKNPINISPELSILPIF